LFSAASPPFEVVTPSHPAPRSLLVPITVSVVNEPQMQMSSGAMIITSNTTLLTAQDHGQSPMGLRRAARCTVAAA
jgi:hypothetical protein